MSTVDRQPITEWVQRLLEAGTGRPVFRSDQVPTTPDYPFCVIHVIDAGEYNGPALRAPERDADLVYQVDSVGQRSDSAEWLADRVRRTILARYVGQRRFQVERPDPTGYKIVDRGPYGMGGTMPGDSTGGKPPEVVSWPERFVIRVQGA